MRNEVFYMKIGKRLLCLTLALLLAVSLLPISALAVSEEAVAAAYAAIKEAIENSVDGVNATLKDPQYISGGVTVAKLEYLEGKTGKIDCKFITPDFLAVQLITVPFLSKLFGYKEIKSIYFVGMPEESSGLVSNPLALTGQNDQMFIMLGILAAFGTKYPTKFPESLSQDTQVSILDGAEISVELNGQTADGISYTVSVTVYFFNVKHTVTFEGDNITEKSPEDVAYGETISFPEAEKGYRITGWTKTYTDFDGEEKTEQVTAESEIMGKFDVTYTAQTSSIAQDVKFHHNDGTETSETVTQTYGQNWEKPSDPEWAEHTFAGWHTKEDSGSQISGNYDDPKVTDVYAHWTPVTYSITYEMGTENAEKPNSDKTTYDIEDAEITLTPHPHRL